jgi:dihydroneopterin aldolase
MLTIHLHNLLFHSFHGMYKEEKILGNDFEVNVDVSIKAQENITRLRQSVDYVSLYSIIKEVMDQPTPLLEKLVQELAEKIRLFDEKIEGVSISIKKLNPPIANLQGTIGVSYSTIF